MLTKLDRPLKYAHKARITCSQFNFPLDMLRYDRCSPVGPNDVVAMLHTPNTEKHPKINNVVTVVAYSPTKTSPFTIGRWESFGCFVELI